MARKSFSAPRKDQPQPDGQANTGPPYPYDLPPGPRPGAGPHTTVFDFGSSVTLGSFLYRQRSGVDSGIDKFPSVTLTFSDDNNFAGDLSQTITLDTAGSPALWVGYNLTTPQTARFVQAEWSAGAGNPGGAELDFNSAQHLTNPSIVSVSSEFNSSFNIGRLFDDDPTTDWAGSGPGPHTLVLDFGNKVEVDSFEFLQRSGADPSLDKFGTAQLTFSDDNDFSNDSSVMVNLIADPNLHVYDLPSAQQGQFLEIIFGDSSGGNPGGLELDFFGRSSVSQIPEPMTMTIWSLIGLAGAAVYCVRSRSKNKYRASSSDKMN